jgi:peptidoglycan/LPS O-acetylase OafA/YrhL
MSQSEFGGGNAVLMFFIMSGFLMMCGYAGKADVTKRYDLSFAKSFMLNRIARFEVK